MSMVINTNILANNARRSLNGVGTKQAKASARLSSGQRINSAADDAAGLAISDKMKAQIKGLQQAERNVQDGISLIQTAEGGMSEISEMVIRQRELTIQAMNDTNTADDRAKIQLEIDQLTYEIDSMAEKTEFNTIPLLNVPGSGEMIRVGQEVILASWEAVMLSPNGTNAQIESLFNDFLALNAPYDIDEIHRIAGRLYEEVEKGNEAFVNIIETVNGIVASMGDGAFNDISLSLYRVQVDFHYNDKPHYEGIFWGPAKDGSAEALTETDPNTAFNSLKKAFDGAWGSGVGMVACHEPVSIAAWDLLEDVEFSTQNALYIQSGANSNQGLYIDRYDCRTSSLGIKPIIIDPIAQAKASLNKLDNSLDKLNGYRANAGAQQNRLEYTANSLAVAHANMEESKSRIADADMAKEMMELTKANVLSQASISMLAQARQQPESVLQLLRG